MQTKVQDQLTPYLHGKKPLQSEDDNERLPMLFIDLGTNNPDGDQASDDVLSIGQRINGESEENQSLSEG